MSAVNTGTAAASACVKEIRSLMTDLGGSQLLILRDQGSDPPLLLELFVVDIV